jgi:uncharacterized protein (DUF362 family)/NAD-dependent dihydropyrimidine dehydrogenase PreA subunit
VEQRTKEMNMDSRVFAVRCPDYDQAEERMKELLAMMGGIGRYAAPGDKLVLKVSLLLAAEPQRAVTTHPAVVAAVGRMARAEGARPVITDSPGSSNPYNERALRRIYETSGMYDAAEQAGIEVNLDTTFQAVSFPEGRLTKRLDVINPVVNCDGVLNVCKLKTHAYMGMTGAIKNSFGVIPGRTKAGYHAKLADPTHFGGVLLDVSAYVAPRLSIMDAVVGMEGDGPSAGTPRKIGLLLASESPLALDVVASEIIGLPRERNQVLLEADRRGLNPTCIEEINLMGMDVSELAIGGFELPVTFLGGGGFGAAPWWQRMLVPLFRPGLSVRPRVIPEKCVACGACRDACPVQVITIGRDGHNYAQIDHQNCIRCYCCHEMCPEDAIELQSSTLYRLLGRL